VETNPSNICICPTDIRFTACWYYSDGIDTDVKYGCLWMLDWLVSTHPYVYMCFILTFNHRHLNLGRLLKCLASLPYFVLLVLLKAATKIVAVKGGKPIHPS